MCVRVCEIFILKVIFRKLRFIKDMGGDYVERGSVSFFFLLLFFLDCVKYDYYQQQ